MRSLSMRRIALLAAWTVAAFTCDGAYKVRTCCKNQMVHIDKYNSDFLAYVCAYDSFAFLIPDGNLYCGSKTVMICCNMKAGYIAPLGDGRQHSEPSDFRCEGLSGQTPDTNSATV